MAERETVNVGCKVPNGLRLHVMKRREHPIDALSEAGMPGMAMFEDKGIIELAGFSPVAHPGRPAATAGFTAVDKELFDIWMEENKGNSLVTSGVVYSEDARRAEEEKKIKSEAPKAESPEEPKLAEAALVLEPTPAPAPKPLVAPVGADPAVPVVAAPATVVP